MRRSWLAHSDKHQAAPTWKRIFGFHPMTAFIDHGSGGTGEAAALPGQELPGITRWCAWARAWARR